MVGAVHQREPGGWMMEMFAELQAAKACSQHDDVRLFVFRHARVFIQLARNAIIDSVRAFSLSMSSTKHISRLRLRVTAAAESILRSGHPWLFADSIKEQNRPGQLGELAVIFDRNDRFLAVGLYDPDSPLRARILHAGKPLTIDRHRWCARLQQNLARRHR